MAHHFAKIIEALAVTGTVASIIYYSLCLWSATSFLTDAKGEQESPPHTISTSGLNPEAAARHRS